MKIIYSLVIFATFLCFANCQASNGTDWLIDWIENFNDTQNELDIAAQDVVKGVLIGVSELLGVDPSLLLDETKSDELAALLIVRLVDELNYEIYKERFNLTDEQMMSLVGTPDFVEYMSKDLSQKVTILVESFWALLTEMRNEDNNTNDDDDDNNDWNNWDDWINDEDEDDDDDDDKPWDHDDDNDDEDDDDDWEEHRGKREFQKLVNKLIKHLEKYIDNMDDEDDERLQHYKRKFFFLKHSLQAILDRADQPLLRGRAEQPEPRQPRQPRQSRDSVKRRKQPKPLKNNKKEVELQKIVPEKYRNQKQEKPSKKDHKKNVNHKNKLEWIKNFKDMFNKKENPFDKLMSKFLPF